MCPAYLLEVIFFWLNVSVFLHSAKIFSDRQTKSQQYLSHIQPWDLLSVSLLNWTVSLLCGLPQSLRIPEAPDSSCCSPHMEAVVFARPKSLFQGCYSLSQEVDFASACSRRSLPFSCICQGCWDGLLPPSGLSLQVSRDDSSVSLQCVIRLKCMAWRWRDT